MKMVGAVALTAVAVGLGACAYKVQPVTVAAHNVVTSYSTKIPGKWLVAVDATPLDQQSKSSSMACSAYKFPLELSGPFSSSLNGTLPNIFESVEMIPAPIPGDQVKARGARGIVVVRGDEVRARLDVQPGFWTANMKGEVTVIASVYVDGPGGRLYGSTARGTRCVGC